jgi:hypothetical protein
MEVEHLFDVQILSCLVGVDDSDGDVTEAMIGALPKGGRIGFGSAADRLAAGEELLAGRVSDRVVGRGGATGAASASLDPQALNLLVERRKRDLEALRGLGLIPSRAL